MTEELKIKVTADTSDFDGKMDKVGKKVDEASKTAEKSQGKWGSFGAKMSALSPTFGKVASEWQEQSSKISDAFGGCISASKVFKIGVLAALAAIALKAAKVAWQFAKDTAKMFDPKGYSKAAGSLQKSVKKVKTTIGSFTAPLVNGIMSVVSKIVDGINWVLEKIRIGIAFITGIIKAVFQPVIDGIKTVISWIQQGINMLANLLGFGDVFKQPAEDAQATADSMGEAVEATSAGLASFDQLNTLDMSNAGDAEQADKLSDSIADASKTGQDLIKNLRSKLSDLISGLNIKDKLKSLADKLGSVWGSFTEKAGNAWGKVTAWAGGLWQGFLEWGGNAWNSICAVAGAIWNAICGIATTVWNTICSVATTIWNGIQAVATAVWDVISGVATAVWEGLTAFATAAWNTIQTVATTVWSIISGVATAIWNGIYSLATGIWNGIQTVATTVWDIISKPILAVWNTFKNLSEGAWNRAKELGEDFNEKIIDPIKNAIQWVIDKIEWAIDKISDLKDSVVGGVTSFAEDPVGGITSIPGKIADKIGGLLHLADGGVVQPNNPFPVIVGDNTREPEVISPLSTIRQAVSEALAQSGGAGGSASGPIEISINLDGRKIARAVYDPLQTEARRRGAGA